jgi:hypothetical protein
MYTSNGGGKQDEIHKNTSQTPFQQKTTNKASKTFVFDVLFGMHVPWLARLKNTRQLRPTCKCSPRPKSPRPAVPRKNRHHPGPVLPRTRRRPASALPRSQVTRISFISCPRWVHNRHTLRASCGCVHQKAKLRSGRKDLARILLERRRRGP